jgi:hypothetical protein
MKVTFDENIGSDTVISWGVSVPILKSCLFGETEEERRRTIEEKITVNLNEIIPAIEREVGKIDTIKISLASAWVRYYVFKLECSGDKNYSFALDLLAPNSPLVSFKRYRRTISEICSRFPENVAKPIFISDEIMLQEWVSGKPLSDFKDGDILVDEENARKCIPLTSSFLYRLKKAGYIYMPWDDYEVMLKDGNIVMLDITRFEKRDLPEEEFFSFYYGVPFTPPEVIKPNPENPAHRLYWRGVSDKDYFGTDRKDYIRLFLLGVARECDSLDEFKRVCKHLDIKNIENLWHER